ncbi:dolichyl-phosphate-mannose-glycolipid alpha-mannosyltransferase like [Propionibacterium ruminifibrarum]|uniref:Dolichyl-phosphate-mannose-glycolipid alpha-mannosyltransferase like n=1 Tax=Propionibacterium ruminifibrarum TaxID=1962131 RepID=A0A375I3Q2_9ACTN|nr:dolichyl-phosphate-mannose-glycolipid alpha-mannosyltransferase like [Propionibacterium ruminifibrarum]
MARRGAPVSRRSGSTRTIVMVWACTRALLAAVLLHTVSTNDTTIGRALGNWDVQHYLAIATSGYADRTDMAFFPGIPLVMHVATLLGLPAVETIAAVSALASLAAALAMGRLGGQWAAVAWLLAPMAVFTVVGYTEALFCAFGLWAWVLARRGHWWGAALLAALACTTRISGVFLVAGLVLLALAGGEPTVEGAVDCKRTTSPPARIRHAVIAALPLLVVVAFFAHLHGITGSWDAWFSAQRAGWDRSWTTPWQSLQNTLFATDPASWPDEPTRAWIFRFEIVSAAAGLVTVIVALARRAWAQAGYVLTQLLALTTATWFLSVNRGDLLWFPMFIGIGWLIARRPASRGADLVRAIVWLLVTLADLVLMAWWARLFFLGHWAS